MILLNGSNIKKMFLDETLFDSVSFNVDSNDKRVYGKKLLLCLPM